MTGTDHGTDLDVLALTTRRALQTTDPTAATAKEASAATPIVRIRPRISSFMVNPVAHSPYSPPGYDSIEALFRQRAKEGAKGDRNVRVQSPEVTQVLVGELGRSKVGGKRGRHHRLR